MAKSSKPKSAKKRVKVQTLPTAEKKVSKKEMKKVEGGFALNFEEIKIAYIGNTGTAEKR